MNVYGDCQICISVPLTIYRVYRRSIDFLENKGNNSNRLRIRWSEIKSLFLDVLGIHFSSVSSGSATGAAYRFNEVILSGILRDSLMTRLLSFLLF